MFFRREALSFWETPMSACWTLGSLRRQVPAPNRKKPIFFRPVDLKLIFLCLATKKQTPIAALRLPSLSRNASTKGREESRLRPLPLRPPLGPLGACHTWRVFVGAAGWLMLALASAARLPRLAWALRASCSTARALHSTLGIQGFQNRLLGMQIKGRRQQTKSSPGRAGGCTRARPQAGAAASLLGA